MKKLLTLAVVLGAFAMTSCKKDYTCTCTTTMTGMDDIVQEIPLNDYKKKDAEDGCDALQLSSATTCTL